MQRKDYRWGIWCLFYLSVLWLPGILDQAAAAEKKRDSKPTEASMNLAYQTPTETADIPIIDRTAPAVHQTASFGLG
jgi:hypothetical protein